MKYFNMEQKDGVTEVYIYGDITSWPWTESDVSGYTLARALKDAEGEIIVYINSYGGEVGEALAIYSTLRQKAAQGAKVTTVCDGFACSAASMVFMAGTERVMYPYSMVMIHRAWIWAAGSADELREEADRLEKIETAAYAVYRDNIHISDDELKALLDKETWLDAGEALEAGFSTVTRGASGKAAARVTPVSRIAKLGDKPPEPAGTDDAEGTTPSAGGGHPSEEGNEAPFRTVLQQFMNRKGCKNA